MGLQGMSLLAPNLPEQHFQEWGTPVADIAAMRALPASSRASQQWRVVGSQDASYEFEPLSTTADDGDLVLKPDDLGGGDPGRWEKRTGTGAAIPMAHDLGGAQHTADTLADVNTKISDSTLQIHEGKVVRVTAPVDSIVALVAAASAGDTFILEQGTHTVTAPVVFPALTNITIRGERGAKIAGDNSGLAQIIAIPAGAHGARLIGFEIEAGASDANGVEITGAVDEGVIQDITFSKLGTTLAGNAIQFSPAGVALINWRIMGCHAAPGVSANNWATWFDTDTSASQLRGFRLLNNYIESSAAAKVGSRGIRFQTSGGPRQTLIINNVISDADTSAIELTAGEFCRIESNHIFDVALDTPIICAARRSLIEGNTIDTASVAGVSIEADEIIVNANIIGFGVLGITTLTTAKRYVITDNKIIGVAGTTSGIQVRGEGGVIANNVLMGAAVPAGNGILVTSATAIRNIVSSNYMDSWVTGLHVEASAGVGSRLSNNVFGTANTTDETISASGQITDLSLNPGEIAAITEKTTLVSADLLVIEDSADSDAKKKVQVSNLLTGWTRIGSLSPSGVATAEFAAGITSAFRFYKVIFWAVPVSDTNVGLLLRCSTDGGVSFASGATDYRWARVAFDDAAANVFAGDATGSEILLAFTGVGSDVGEGCSGEVVFVDPADTTMQKQSNWRVQGENSSGQVVIWMGGGQFQFVTAVDGWQFSFSSGNIESGEFILYGAN